MSQNPRRPTGTQHSSSRRHRSEHSSSTPRRQERYDEEAGVSSPVRLGLGGRSPSYQDSNVTTPLNPSGATQDLSRKKSLIRPERNKVTKDNPLYHYNKHAKHMQVQPSTTGIDDAEVEEEEASQSSGYTIKNSYQTTTDDVDRAHRHKSSRHAAKIIKQPSRKESRREKPSKQEKEFKATKRQNDQPEVKPLSFWSLYCIVITFWCPNFVLNWFGKVTPVQKEAFREKIGLISIILMFCTAVGFLTFGFTQVVCGNPVPRLKVNHLGYGYMTINGRAYNLDGTGHPAAPGIIQNANLVSDPYNYTGWDASFLFQNVNGHCKDLIKLAPNSDVPTNSEGDLAWYFPCNLFKSDGSSPANLTIPYYLGYACHTAAIARKAYYHLRVEGEVYFTWDDVRNSTRNLMVFSGNVLDLDLLNWFNKTQVAYPSIFDDLKDTANDQVRGKDVTHLFQSSQDKKMARCLTEIIRVGGIDTETVGCIASKVVLYVSLIFILSIVMIKFFLALFFGWFLSKRLGAKSIMQKGGARKAEIEDWSNDIYQAAPKLKDATDKQAKRGSFFPTKSRFTSPYATEKPQSKYRPAPTTMGSQSSSSKLLPPSPMFQSNASRGSLYLGQSDLNSRSSVLMMGTSTGDRGSTYISNEPSSSTVVENVVPQPPSEFEPFGYPLVHTICLVTAYSEDRKGMRNTLNSIATTDYPNSHKLILLICDGLIKGHGNTEDTPTAALSMMEENVIPPEEVRPFSYVAVATGRKRHNMAKIHAGFYKYEKDGEVPLAKQQRVPMIIIVKCGTEEERSRGEKPGNRGKRDSQIILMAFLQKVMFDERMTQLEYELFSGIWSITGISPEFYELVLMVDADTKLFPDSLTHMTAAMVNDPEIMGLCGETKIANKKQSWVTMIQVFEYFISHHLAKAFESVFGGVTCLPGCFCMYRIKAPKGEQNYWVPILANPDVVEHYSENVVDTLHKKNLLLLGEDRYLSTLMLKTFPKRKQVFVPQAVCKTLVPDDFKTLLSQRRRWINSTVHNLMELVLVRDLCGTFCFSMQFVVFIELIGTIVLPAAISFTVYLIVISIVAKPTPVIPLILLALILGLPAILIVLTASRWSYVVWMMIYLLSLPIWNFVLPVYAYWHFDDFAWGDTRKVQGEVKGASGHDDNDGEFDSTQIVMRRWRDYEKLRAQHQTDAEWSQSSMSGAGSWSHDQAYASYEHQNL